MNEHFHRPKTSQGYWHLLLMIALLNVFLVALLFLESGRAARAATLCVNPSGTNGCYSSIQAAIDAASPGDTISIAAGQYTANTPIAITKTLTLQGMGPSTIINLLNRNYIDIFDTNGATTLSNLAVQMMPQTGILVSCCSSLILGNIIATGNGGGIYNYGRIITATNVAIYTTRGIISQLGAQTTISNSTLSSLEEGKYSGNDRVTLLSSTILLPSTAGAITAINTIFNGGCGQFVTLTSLGHNIDSGNTCGLNAAGDMVNTNPLLTPPVSVNGTLVDALMSNSPAIDAGDDSVCPSTDQTGFPRPYGVHCDIGAYEWRPMTFHFYFFPWVSK